jgi:CubicO group peptidase (beta-lactamase class C family)
MTELQETVQDLVARTGVPGAVVGVLEDGRIETAAAGIANLNSGVEMTPDTLFLTGSITKVWTTTLLMSLVEQGLVELDAPVKRYLPDLIVGEPGVADALSVRHLVTHTSGIDAGILIAEVGDGDKAIANFVDDLLPNVGQLFAPGEYFSYNNAGFVLAGRIIEVVTGEGYSDAMRQRLFAPLGLERSMFTAKEAILHRMAIGHFPGADGYVPTSRFLMPECLGPAGTTFITSVRDTLTFVQTHLPTVAGPHLLSSESVDRMAAHHIDFPVPETGSVGLSWLRKQHGPRVVLTHGGGSFGGVAMVGVAPDLGAAYIAFANGGAGSMPFHRELAEAILEKRFGVPPQDAPDLSGPAPDPDRYHGVYRSWGAEITITDDGDALSYRPRFTEPIFKQGWQEPVPLRLRPVGARALELADYADQRPFAYGIGDDGTDHPKYLFVMDQLTRRTGDI